MKIHIAPISSKSSIIELPIPSEQFPNVSAIISYSTSLFKPSQSFVKLVDSKGKIISDLSQIVDGMVVYAVSEPLVSSPSMSFSHSLDAGPESANSSIG